MSARYFVSPPIDATHSSTKLTGPEAQHLLRVMRAAVGDQVTLFDGTGVEFTAQITAQDRNSVELNVLERQTIDRERPNTIVLAVSLPKGDRQRVLIEKAVEVGVTRLVPIRTKFSNDFYSPKSVERWERYVIEASKQCGRNRLMQIDSPQDFVKELLPALQQSDSLSGPSPQGWIAHPYEVSGGSVGTPTGASSIDPPKFSNDPHKAIPLRSSSAHWIAVGPEGGFAVDEVQAAEQLGWNRLDLGPRILRVETAAIVAVSRFDPILSDSVE